MSVTWNYCEKCDTYDKERSNIVSFRLSKYMLNYETDWYSKYFGSIHNLSRRINMTEKQFGHFMATRAMDAQFGKVKNSTAELKIQFHRKPQWKKVFIGSFTNNMPPVDDFAQSLANTMKDDFNFSYRTTNGNVDFDVNIEIIGNNRDGKIRDQYNVYVWRKANG